MVSNAFEWRMACEASRKREREDSHATSWTMVHLRQKEEEQLPPKITHIFLWHMNSHARSTLQDLQHISYKSQKKLRQIHPRRRRRRMGTGTTNTDRERFAETVHIIQDSVRGLHARCRTHLYNGKLIVESCLLEYPTLRWLHQVHDVFTFTTQEMKACH